MHHLKKVLAYAAISGFAIAGFSIPRTVAADDYCQVCNWSCEMATCCIGTFHCASRADGVECDGEVFLCASSS